MAVLFTDNFNRANSTTVGNGWSQNQDPGAPSYGIVDNALSITAVSGANKSINIWRTQTQPDDAVLRAKPLQTLGQTHLQLFKITGGMYGAGQEGYEAFFSRNTFGATPDALGVHLRKNVSGVWTTLASTNITSAMGEEATFRYQKSTGLLQVYVGAAKVFEVTDTSHASTSLSYLTLRCIASQAGASIGTSTLEDFSFEDAYAPAGHTVDISAGSGGSVSTAQLTDVDDATGKAFTATPSNGYRVASITPSTGVTVTPAASGQTAATTFTVKATQAGSVLVAFELIAQTLPAEGSASASAAAIGNAGEVGQVTGSASGSFGFDGALGVATGAQGSVSGSAATGGGAGSVLAVSGVIGAGVFVQNIRTEDPLTGYPGTVSPAHWEGKQLASGIRSLITSDPGFTPLPGTSFPSVGGVPGGVLDDPSYAIKVYYPGGLKYRRRAYYNELYIPWSWGGPSANASEYVHCSICGWSYLWDHRQYVIRWWNDGRIELDGVMYLANNHVATKHPRMKPKVGRILNTADEVSANGILLSGDASIVLPAFGGADALLETAGGVLLAPRAYDLDVILGRRGKAVEWMYNGSTGAGVMYGDTEVIDTPTVG